MSFRLAWVLEILFKKPCPIAYGIFFSYKGTVWGFFVKIYTLRANACILWNWWAKLQVQGQERNILMAYQNRYPLWHCVVNPFLPPFNQKRTNKSSLVMDAVCYSSSSWRFSTSLWSLVHLSKYISYKPYRFNLKLLKSLVCNAG